MTNNNDFSKGSAYAAKTASKWIHFVEPGTKDTPKIDCVWREADINNELTFNRYGFGVMRYVEKTKNSSKVVYQKNRQSAPTSGAAR